jgi:nucleoside-diphosphate-sugar epimerase
MVGRDDDDAKILPAIVQALRQHAPIDLTSGVQAREWLHVEDGAEAIVATLERAAATTLNIGTGVGVTVREVAERVATRLGADAHLLRFGVKPQRHDEPRTLVMDVSRAKAELGWRARRGLDDCIDELVR